ncbi:peptide methionine sulfoxide reductase B9 [Chytriomyces cf. hyalinus JEL632]|nr:peptide methionine sulfoxide reductase B9 [Chytriomyces cf. hyalinus JEL632]
MQVGWKWGIAAAMAVPPLVMWMRSTATADFSAAVQPELKVVKSDLEWRKVLSPNQFWVLRKKGTEPPGSGQYNKLFAPGTYNCAACKTPLYKSDAKFDSGTGWPSFHDALPGAITRLTDPSCGTSCQELVCSTCGGHLGHIFKGEWMTRKFDSNARHCVNSASLDFVE